MSRVILAWYMRFDVFAGVIGGFETANLVWECSYPIFHFRLWI